MGNVHAYSSAPPPPPPSGMSAFSKGGKDDCDTEVNENPGPLEEIHTKCKSMFLAVSD